MIEIEDLIKSAVNSILNNEPISRKHIIKLLEINPFSKEAKLLGEASRSIANKATKNKGKIWASIGVDYKPCKMNCSFCSFGEKWGIVKDSYSWTEDEVVEFAREFAVKGAQWIAIRTTEEYELNKLCNIAYKIRNSVCGEYELLANTGDINSKNVEKLLDSGFNYIYHPIRLREGVDTFFDINSRKETLENIKNSKLNLAYWIEPIGIEHTNEEIADAFLMSMKYDTKILGVMARVPVKGTPFFKCGQISEERLAQIGAVIRIASGYKETDVCVHPPSQLAMNWGANVTVVDIGAVPRDTTNLSNEWKGFNTESANNMLKKALYKI